MDVRPFPERVLDGIIRRGVRLPSALPPAQEHAALGGRETGGGGSPRGVGGLDQLPPLHCGPLARADEACDRLVDPARKMCASPVPRAVYPSFGGSGGIVSRRVGGCCCCSTQRAQPPDPQAREPAAAAAQHNAHNLRTPKLLLLLLFNTTRTTSGPPSTGAAIAMDGGVADTQPAITQAVSRRRF